MYAQTNCYKISKLFTLLFISNIILIIQQNFQIYIQQNFRSFSKSLFLSVFRSRKLFSDLYLAKFLDTSTKLFLPYTKHGFVPLLPRVKFLDVEARVYQSVSISNPI